VELEGQRVVVFIIPVALHRPTSFSGREKIRIGQTTHNLKDYPDTERHLWAKLNVNPFEYQFALEGSDVDSALSMLSVESYFDLLEQPMPDTKQEVAEILIQDRVLEHRPSGIAITNLEFTFAKDINQFQHLLSCSWHSIAAQDEML
jgi:predicted HTH transcriptional regulator